MKIKDLSFATKLSIYILSVVLIIFCIIILLLYRYNSEQKMEDVKIYSSAILQHMVDDVTSDLQDVKYTLALEKQSVEEQLDNLEKISEIISNFVSQENAIMGGSVALTPNFYPDKGTRYMEYLYLDSIGTLQHKTLTDTSNYDYLQMDWYKEAIDAGKCIISEPYYDKGAGDRLIVTCSDPIRNEAGEICGVITADISLIDLVDALNQYKPYPNSYPFIVCKNGMFFAPCEYIEKYENFPARSEEVVMLQDDGIGRVLSKIIKDKRGAEQLNLNGKDVIICYSPIKEANWSIAYICPRNAILSSLGNFTINIVAIVLFALLLLSIGIHLIIRRQSAPITALTRAANTISTGNLNATLPEKVTNKDLRQLRDAFADMQVDLKEHILRLTEATRINEHIASELAIAHDIQMSLIPHDFSTFDGAIAAMLRPAKEVGGDFYDVIRRNDKIYVAIGDVAGKGVPASLIMASTCTRFRTLCMALDNPQEIVSQLNNALCEEDDSNMFITAFVGILDINSHKLTFCNAGHNPALIMKSNGETTYMETIPNLPLRVIPDFDYRSQSVDLKPGDTLMLYTDGLTEAENNQHEQLGNDAPLAELSACRAMSTADMLERMTATVDKFADGAEQSDDLTLLILTIPHHLTLTNRMEELERLPEFVETVCEENGVPAEKVMPLNLAIEEALVNVINYGFPNGEEGEISVTAKRIGESLEFIITDNGIPFDPTQAPAADTTSSAEERAIGGLGIHLIRSIMSDISYTRSRDLNKLRTLYTPTSHLK